MAAPVRRVEEFYLKIFKVTMLILMGLALAAILVLLAAAAYEYFQTPKEPPPARKVPEKEISLEDLKTVLIEEEKNKNRKAPRQQSGGAQPSLRFLEEATALYRCSVEFGKNVGAEVEETDNEKAARLVQDLRQRIEDAANDSIRGEPWVRAAVAFTCKTLADNSVIGLRKDGKIGAVFIPTLRFHIGAWDAIQTEKQRFEQAEYQRVASARAQETMRVGAAKARAITYVIAAGSAFGLFMMLALYLLFAKIETNLRDINEAVRIANPQKIAP